MTDITKNIKAEVKGLEMSNTAGGGKKAPQWTGAKKTGGIVANTI